MSTTRGVEFFLYTGYNPASMPLADRLYTQIFEWKLSGVKTLGNSSYFGNEPRTFDFALKYDSWLEDNIIAETNDISREFSKYVIRVWDNSTLVFSGLLELAYFNIDHAQNLVHLKAYDWLVLLNKASNYIFWSYNSLTNSFQHPYYAVVPGGYETTDSYMYSVYDADLYELSNWVKVVISMAQSRIWPDTFQASKTIAELYSLAIIKPYVSIENIILTKEAVQLRYYDLFYRKVDYDFEGHAEGWMLNAAGRATYIFVFFIRRDTNVDYFELNIKVATYNGIDITTDKDNTYTGVYGSAYMTTAIDEVNAICRDYGNINFNVYAADGHIAQYFPYTEVTDGDGNKYTRAITATNRVGDENIYFDIFLVCDYITNGQSVAWVANTNLSISQCLRTATICSNGCFIITDDNVDEIKYVSKWKDNGTAVIAISDDDVIDDYQTTRLPKQSIDVDSINSTIRQDFSSLLIGRLQTYYNNYFDQINKKITFTLSTVFNSYDLSISDIINVYDDDYVVIGLQKISDKFIKVEAMNYLMAYLIDENSDYIVDENGNYLTFYNN